MAVNGFDSAAPGFSGATEGKARPAPRERERRSSPGAPGGTVVQHGGLRPDVLTSIQRVSCSARLQIGLAHRNENSTRVRQTCYGSGSVTSKSSRFPQQGSGEALVMSGYPTVPGVLCHASPRALAY